MLQNIKQRILNFLAFWQAFNERFAQAEQDNRRLRDDVNSSVGIKME